MPRLNEGCQIARVVLSPHGPASTDPVHGPASTGAPSAVREAVATASEMATASPAAMAALLGPLP
jgi:hypothetical protein